MPLWYQTGRADEYLAITGVGIESIRIKKAGWVWPMQRVRPISPYNAVVHAYQHRFNVSVFNLMTCKSYIS